MVGEENGRRKEQLDGKDNRTKTMVGEDNGRIKKQSDEKRNRRREPGEENPDKKTLLRRNIKLDKSSAEAASLENQVLTATAILTGAVGCSNWLRWNTIIIN